MNKSVMLFIPAYRCEKQIVRVLNSLNNEVISSLFVEIVVIENISPDNTLNVAIEKAKQLSNLNITVIQNDENYSLGGSHKVAFNYFLEKGYDYLVVLHGDDQGDIKDIVPVLSNLQSTYFDTLLGARFHKQSKLIGYSNFRIFGNHVLNFYLSLMSFHRVLDMGSGLNLYSKEFLKNKFYLPFPNDLTFNISMLLYTFKVKAKYQFFPLTWKEDDQISNAKIFKQAIKIAKLGFRYFFNNDCIFKDNNSEKVYTYKIKYSQQSCNTKDLNICNSKVTK
ncbi:MAG: glycosyltransferase family 2 protein [Succinivibrio sp.]|nr:glycosyltransferase family 2 protein [Succinivibrio sp.]